MKKFLLILSAVTLLLLAGCAKDEAGSEPGAGEMVKASFTAVMQGTPQTKAVADGDGQGTKANRCVMEIYYKGVLYQREVKSVSDMKATFTPKLASNRTYDVLFWADCGEGLADKYYTTNAEGLGLQAVEMKAKSYDANDDARDAFFVKEQVEVLQQVSSKTFELKRPFAQVNIITTDASIIEKGILYPDGVEMVYTAPTKFNLLTGALSNEENLTIKGAPYASFDKDKAELTLAMDYLFAGLEKSVLNINFKASKTGEKTTTHSFANIPVQRNYRTNIKGALLTTTGQWTVEVDPIWGVNGDGGEIDHIIASNYTDVVNALQSGNDSKNMKVTVTPAAVNNLSDAEKAQVIVNETIDGAPVKALKFVLYEEKTIGDDIIHHASPEHVEFELPERPTGVQAWKIEHETNYPTQTVVVSTKAENDANIIIEAPKSTVTLEATKINSVVSTTSENTLIIPQGLELKNLTVKMGAVEYHGVGLKKVTVNALEGAKVYFKTSEGLANTDDVYGVVKDHIAEGFAITKESETAWKIVPEVCKIGEVGYASLADAVAAVPTDGNLTTITMVNDFASTEKVAIAGTQNVVLDLNGKKISYTSEGHGSFIENKGQLKVQDSGTNGIITAEFTAPNWSAGCYTIDNFGASSASKLVIESGTIENTSPAGLAWPINNGSWGTSADLVINGGTIHSTNYVPVREYLQYGGKKTISINGGKLISDNSRAIAVQLNDAEVADQGSYVEINGGEFSCNGSGILYVDLHAANLNTTGFTMTVNSGKFKNANAEAPVLVYDNEGKDQSSAVLLSGILKGGVYSKKPADEIVAECYISAENADEAYPWKVKLDAPEGAVAKINSTFYNSLQEAFNAVQNEQTIELLTDITVEPKGTSNNFSNTSMTFNRSGISAVLDLCGHTINGDVTINKLLYVQKGNLSIRNGTIKHCYEEHGVYHTAIYIDNDASCPVITDLNINVSGTGIRLLSKASIGTLNAHIDSWVACKPSSGTTDFVCIYLSSADSKITNISGGYYASYMKNYVNTTSGTGAIYINNGTIQEISGGTFLGMYANGGTIRIDNGKIQKFSDGYVGFYEKTIDGQLCAFDKIDQITGGKFMSPQSSLENFERTKDQSSRVSALRAKVTSSGLLLVSKGEKVTVQNIKDGSSITMDVYEAVGNRLSIDGNGNPISVQVKRGEKVIFPEEKTSVSGKKGFWFTASEGGEQVAYSPCALLNTSDRTLYFRLEDACLVTIKCPTYNNYVDVKSVSSGIVVRNNTGSSSQYMYVLKGEKISVVDYTLNEYTNSFGTYEMLGWKIDNQIENIEKNVEYVINKDVTVTFNSKKKQ